MGPSLAAFSTLAAVALSSITTPAQHPCKQGFRGLITSSDQARKTASVLHHTSCTGLVRLCSHTCGWGCVGLAVGVVNVISAALGRELPDVLAVLVLRQNNVAVRRDPKLLEPKRVGLRARAHANLFRPLRDGERVALHLPGLGPSREKVNRLRPLVLHEELDLYGARRPSVGPIRSEHTQVNYHSCAPPTQASIMSTLPKQLCRHIWQ